MRKINENIYSLRKQQNMSLEELGKKIGSIPQRIYDQIIHTNTSWINSWINCPQKVFVSHKLRLYKSA